MYPNILISQYRLVNNLDSTYHFLEFRFVIGHSISGNTGYKYILLDLNSFSISN